MRLPLLVVAAAVAVVIVVVAVAVAVTEAGLGALNPDDEDVLLSSNDALRRSAISASSVFFIATRIIVEYSNFVMAFVFNISSIFCNCVVSC